MGRNGRAERTVMGGDEVQGVEKGSKYIVGSSQRILKTITKNSTSQHIFLHMSERKIS